MKRIYLILSIVFTIFAFSIVINAADFSVIAEDGRTFEGEGETFNLPSYVSPSRVTVSFSGKTLAYSNAEGNRVSLSSGDTIDITPFEQTTPYGQKFYVVNFYVNNNQRTVVFNFGSLPSIHIETTMGAGNITKNNAKDEQTKINVVNKDGTYEYVDSQFVSELKVRGNATTAYAKKPFQMKLNIKTDLFGMGSSKTWILLANYDDQSNIRNNIMYKIGELLGMDTCEFQLVDLFLDGQYYGVYLLCEKVQISSSRVDIEELEKENDSLNTMYAQSAVKVSTGIANTIITEYSYIPGIKNPADITGGYLIELDNNYWQGELCYFITSNGSHYVIKSPEYASKEQVEYIATLFGEMEEAMMSDSGYNRLGRHYSEYIDVDSFVYAYIVAEFGRNFDAGSSSMYFYKDRDYNGEVSKIVKGPLWDCDNTIGNIHKNGASNEEGYWARGRSIWAGLTKHDDFNQKVTEEFARVYDQIFDMIDVGGYVYDIVEELGNSIHMERARWNSDNYSKWPLYYDGIHYDRWQSQAPVFSFIDGPYSYDLDKDESTVIGYLCEHIEGRANWLASEWNCNVALRERSFVEKEPDDIVTPPSGDDTTDSSIPSGDTTDTSLPGDDTSDSCDDTTDTSLPEDDTSDSSVPSDDTTDTSLPEDDISDSSVSSGDTTDTSLPGDDTSDSSVPSDNTTDTSTSNSDQESGSSTDASSSTVDSSVEEDTGNSGTGTTTSSDEKLENSDSSSDEDDSNILIAIIAILSILAVGGITTAIIFGIKLRQ